jgi:exonuclease VII large subunit
MYRLLFFLLLFAGLTACNNETPSGDAEKTSATGPIAEEDQAWDDVMVLHDEVMPRMSDLHRTRQNLKDFLETADQNPTINEMKEEVVQAMSRLDEASEGMMQWMYEFKQLGPLRDSLDHDGIMSYLETEKARMLKVKKDFDTSLETAFQLMRKMDDDQEDAIDD